MNQIARTPDRRYTQRRHRLTILSDPSGVISMAGMRFVLLFCAAVTLGLTRTDAQEKITLTVAESNPEYRIAHFNVTFDDPATSADEGVLFMDLRGTNGENVPCRYWSNTNPTGTFLNNNLNRANLSSAYAGNATTGSLKQRVAHRLVVMGESASVCSKSIVGTLAGTVP